MIIKSTEVLPADQFAAVRETRVVVCVYEFIAYSSGDWQDLQMTIEAYPRWLSIRCLDAVNVY